MKKISLIIMSIIFLTACATSYHRDGLTGGYSEMALSSDTYQVFFRGNGYTSQSRVNTHLLRRCAELTKEKGFKYFIAVNGGSEVSQSQWETPTTINSNSTGGYYNNNTYSVISPGQVYTLNKFTNSAVIKMFNSNEKYPMAFDANIVLSNFAPNIVLPRPMSNGDRHLFSK